MKKIVTVLAVVMSLLMVGHSVKAQTKFAYISVNDLIIKAAASALKKVPEANASYSPEGIALHHHADVAMAVAIDGGLITPIIRAAETKTLAQIATESKDLAAFSSKKFVLDRSEVRFRPPGSFDFGSTEPFGQTPLPLAFAQDDGAFFARRIFARGSACCLLRNAR